MSQPFRDSPWKVPQYLVVGCLITLTACSGGTKEAPSASVESTVAAQGESTVAPPAETTVPATASAAVTTPDLSAVKTFGKQTQNHVEGAVVYPQSPPVGGDHNAAWQNCGSYAEPVPNELAVHSIEHGAVWIAYRPDLAAADVKFLQSLAVDQTHILVAPYVDLSSPVVLTAWSTQLVIDKVDDPRIAAFIETYQEGPQSPEPAAPCSGGMGTPL
jgi:hypothetical protein